MNLDLTAEFILALRSTSGREALAEALAPVVATEMRKAFAEREEKLETLAAILGIAKDTARKKLARSPDLRALGVLVGRQYKFKRSTALAYFAAKAGK